MNHYTYLSAQEAAQELGVTVATLYSYVSRGLVRSMATSQDKRQRRYSYSDVERLKERNTLRNDPQGVLLTALRWGAPVLESRVTLIDGGRYYYRGQDAVGLARTRSFEDVACLIWESDDFELLSAQLPPVSHGAIRKLLSWKHLSPVERFQTVLPMVQAEDPASYATTQQAVIRTGSGILRLLACVATEDAIIKSTGALPHECIASTLSRAWAPRDERARCLFDMALVLLADHEFNVSSFAARCVASAGSTPYAVVQAGLAALQGHRHGGMAEHAFEMIDEASNPEVVQDIVAARLRRGESIPGFGHPLYPNGDPRGEALFGRIRDSYSESKTVEVGSAFVEVMRDMTGVQPNIDFPLALMCRVLGLPHGTAIAIFSISRTVGWIAQAMEQYSLGALIRPRANYTGILPFEE